MLFVTRFFRLGLFGVIAALAACAEVPADPGARAEYDRVNDPAEPTNRAIFEGNQFLDRNVLKPVATGYQDYVPGGVRRRVGSFASNLGEPKVLVNDLLQGNVGRAWNTTQRFVVNTTVGGAGLFDVATDWDLPHHQADYGQTFGVWGMGPGPAVQLPLLGSTNLRDGVGTVVGFVANPLSFIPGSEISTITTAAMPMGMMDGRARVLGVTNDLEKNSLDLYAALRSMDAQRRKGLVEEGRIGAVSRGPTVEIGPVTVRDGSDKR